MTDWDAMINDNDMTFTTITMVKETEMDQPSRSLLGSTEIFTFEVEVDRTINVSTSS